MINIKKKPIPDKLAELIITTKKYRHTEVVEKIKEDFNNKCYICELKESPSINVEHFTPHKGNEELKLKWSNLYFACAHCNGIKGARYDDIIDPLNTNGEIPISHKMDVIPKSKVKIKALVEDTRTNNTAKLLDEVFNSKSDSAPVRFIESQNLRKKLFNELKEFQNSLYDYYEEEDFPEDKEKARKSVIRHLSGRSQFTAFKRWMIIDNEELYNEFKEYFNRV